MVNIYIFGKCHSVPDDLTVLRAMEYVGIRLVQGCGCRSGFCGACAVLCRTEKDDVAKVRLACRTAVENNMHISALPKSPVTSGIYGIDMLLKDKIDKNIIAHLYPEINNCLGCNLCTKSCVQGINVMKFIQYAKNGEINKCAEESFECVMCGACAKKCPADIPQKNIALLARRINGKYIIPRSAQLKNRVEEIKNGEYDELIKELKAMSDEELTQLYNSRVIEK